MHVEIYVVYLIHCATDYIGCAKENILRYDCTYWIVLRTTPYPLQKSSPGIKPESWSTPERAKVNLYPAFVSTGLPNPHVDQKVPIFGRCNILKHLVMYLCCINDIYEIRRDPFFTFAISKYGWRHLKASNPIEKWRDGEMEKWRILLVGTPITTMAKVNGFCFVLFFITSLIFYLPASPVGQKCRDSVYKIYNIISWVEEKRTSSDMPTLPSEPEPFEFQLWNFGPPGNFGGKTGLLSSFWLNAVLASGLPMFQIFSGKAQSSYITRQTWITK